MKRPFVTIILAGGKGTRMGTSDKHKVCFEVLGVPVIIRALETYNLCGAVLNVVVVGSMAESVMATVTRRFPGTPYAFQDQPRGTGDAARKGADLLERMRFDGDVLVVAGDKVIDPKVIRQLLSAHEQSGADVTLATASRPPSSSAGILLKSARGNIVGILEEAERLRLVALARINAAFGRKTVLPGVGVENILTQVCGPKTARAVAAEIWGGESLEPAARGSRTGDNPLSPAASSGQRLAAGRVLSRQDFERRFSKDERQGCLKVAGRTVPASQMLERFDQMNLSTYLFRAPVLYDALHRLKSGRASQEEYLTDVFEILARRPKPVRVAGCQVQDLRGLMAYNNPQELLAIEEIYRQDHGPAVVEAPAACGEMLAPASAWDNLLRNPSAAARRKFRQWYGEEVPWQQIRGALGAFMQRYGKDRQVAIVRSPGRINLMGRHIDHQGGTVNVMAVNREIIMVAAPRADDAVALANTEGGQFSEETFRISDLVASLNWDDWQRVIDGPRLQRLLDAARGNWANYVKAAILRLQELFRDRRLRGLDMMVSGDIPMGAGLSSSSALVVATAEAVRLFNRLPVSARRLVSLCGEGEWFVGTRGGAADHAAIRLSHRGCVTRVGFFPFRIEDSAPFFPGHDLVTCNSGVYAVKARGARNTFNAKVTAYHIGRVWFKMLRPDLAPRIEHLRDINPERLGLRRAEFGQLLCQLPARITRSRVQAAFGQMADAERDRLERLFLSHEAPADGYAVRGVVLFGLSEMARAQRCLALLKRNDARGLGRLMSISHDGDRVSRQTSRNTWRRVSTSSAEGPLMAWSRHKGRGADFAELPGDYGCSLPELDRIVDIARRQPGVEGAQLAGAGLGGCIMVLVQKPHTADLLKALSEADVRAEVFRPIAGACSLMMR
ncbi:MAG TPA: galactokinase family protein [Verrucomicrobiota bacterium]|nr:galactokinase family protein [Verrucomicrobiota bacterium]HQL78426.1 galactokinase family protein [Verrucomicrobiota bacterium]